MFGLFGHGGFGNNTFEAHYRAMPMAFIDKQSAEFGDKVILPPSALDRLASLHIEYPMLFKVEGPRGRSTHCGVLEFIAEEGVVYMPHWMMQNLLLQVGDTVRFRNVSLPKGKYVKLQPVTSDFLDITNPKAVLERTLRSYTCLTVGDCFVVNYNNKTYEIEVKEAKPGPAISVVETDCQVDFEAPKDYKEPERVKPTPMQEDPKPEASGTAGKAAAGSTATAAGAGAAPSEPEPEPAPTFLAFAGTARRLDGKSAGPANPVTVSIPTTSLNKGVLPPEPPKAGSSAGAAAPSAGGPKAGTLVTNRLEAKLLKEKEAKGQVAPPPPPPEEKKEEGPSFKAFSGTARRLK